MRLFVGVQLEEAMVSAAAKTVRQLRRRLPPHLPIRWVALENLHITVRFIGNVREDRASDVLLALRGGLRIAPFALELAGCGAFPSSGPPRVLWIGLAGGLPELRMMHAEFDRRLAPLGFEPESRAFSAHLTLARVTDAPRSATRAVREAIAGVVPTSARCTIQSATVFESRLSSKGATYLPIFDVPCMG